MEHKLLNVNFNRLLYTMAPVCSCGWRKLTSPWHLESDWEDHLATATERVKKNII
jgi:hypothetical protein